MRATDTTQMTWWQAFISTARPKTFVQALMPVLVGTMLAKSMGIKIDIEITFFTLLTALFIIIGTNFLSDAFDTKRETEDVQRVGPIRGIHLGAISPTEVYRWGILAFALSAFCSLPLVLVGGWPIALLTVISIICGYCYTGGPNTISHCGLADLFVFLFFGLAATSSTFYLQSGFIDAKIVLAGAQCGMFATMMMAINDFRDYYSDSRTGKRTLAVRFGLHFSRYEITLLALLPFCLSFLWLAYSYMFAGLLPLILIPFARKIISTIWVTEPGVACNQPFYESGKLHLAFGILFSLGLWLHGI